MSNSLVDLPVAATVVGSAGDRRNASGTSSPSSRSPGSSYFVGHRTQSFLEKLFFIKRDEIKTSADDQSTSRASVYSGCSDDEDRHADLDVESDCDSVAYETTDDCDDDRHLESLVHCDIGASVDTVPALPPSHLRSATSTDLAPAMRRAMTQTDLAGLPVLASRTRRSVSLGGSSARMEPPRSSPSPSNRAQQILDRLFMINRHDHKGHAVARRRQAYGDMEMDHEDRMPSDDEGDDWAINPVQSARMLIDCDLDHIVIHDYIAKPRCLPRVLETVGV